jgi:hypothetical protein
MTTEEQLEMDLKVYGVKVEQLIDGVIHRLDPTTIRYTTIDDLQAKCFIAETADESPKKHLRV